jgi:gliding motility-associated lipoprotein GldD
MPAPRHAPITAVLNFATIGIAIISSGLLVASCGQKQYPRPKGYPRIELPAHAYQTFKQAGCPFTFEYPAYGKAALVRADSCDLNIRFERLGCTWHLTYQNFNHTRLQGNKTGRISRTQSFEAYRKLIYKHGPKATEIYETTLRTPAGRGTFFELYGEVPTSAQVYLSDSLNQAVMVSVYFNTALKNDSLAPVIDFMKADLRHFANTLRWVP